MQRLLAQQKSANDRVRTALRLAARTELDQRRHAEGMHASGLPWGGAELRRMEAQYHLILHRERERRARERRARKAAGLTDSSSSGSDDDEGEDSDEDQHRRGAGRADEQGDDADRAALSRGAARVDVDIVRRLCGVCLEKKTKATDPVLVCAGCKTACHAGACEVANLEVAFFCTASVR